MADRVDTLFEAQCRLLNEREVESAANRQGLRLASGDLLETAFVDLVGLLQPDISVEVGAHEADYSLAVKTRLPDARVLAFEANPAVHAAHAARIAESGLDVDYLHMAICERTGSAVLNIPVARNATQFDVAGRISSLDVRGGSDWQYEKVEVPANRLDDALAQENFERGVAWVDAEGAQGAILKGGAKFFSSALAVYIEVETKRIWSSQFLVDDITSMLGMHGLRPMLRDNLAQHQYNQVFIRPEAEYLDHVLALAEDYVARMDAAITSFRS